MQEGVDHYKHNFYKVQGRCTVQQFQKPFQSATK